MKRLDPPDFGIVTEKTILFTGGEPINREEEEDKPGVLQSLQQIEEAILRMQAE